MTKATTWCTSLGPSHARRRILAGVLCLAGLVAMPVSGAAASSPSTRDVGGFIVTMPGDDALRALQPGDRVAVTLEATAKSRRRHSVAVVTLSRRGEAGSIARSRLAAGTFSAQIPPAVDGTYSLLVKVTGKGFKVAFTEVTFEVSIPDPVLTGPCGELPDDVSAELGVSNSRPRPGAKVNFSLANTGPGCLTTGFGFVWQVSRGGAWVDVPLNLVATTALVSLQPGSALQDTFTVPAGSAPGQYRIVKHFRAAGQNEEISVEVEVVARRPCQHRCAAQ
jgi:hypothetical protein